MEALLTNTDTRLVRAPTAVHVRFGVRQPTDSTASASIRCPECGFDFVGGDGGRNFSQGNGILCM